MCKQITPGNAMQGFKLFLHFVRTQNGLHFFAVYLHNITTADPKEMSCENVKSHISNYNL
jgi:hypothetical protein